MGAAIEISGSGGGSGSFAAVSCTDATDCTAVGTDGAGQPVYDTERRDMGRTNRSLWGPRPARDRSPDSAARRPPAPQ